MDDLLRLVLRLFGVLYLLAAIVGLRAVAMDRLLSHALAALSPGRPRETAADTFRNRFLTVSSLLVGAASLALVALVEVALPLLVATVASQIVYLAYLAPRFVDPHDPPDPDARRKSVLATGVIAAGTVLAFAAHRRGILVSIGEAPVAALLALAGFAALCLYLLYLARASDPTRGDGAGSGPAAGDWAEASDPADPIDVSDLSIVLTPSWGDLGVLDAETGEPISYAAYEALLTEPERELMADWNGLFIEVADPTDPRRVRMSAPDGLARLEERGRPIHESVVARLGRDRVSFEPAPRPRGPCIRVAAVKMMADYGSDALWFHDEERVGCFSPEEFGLSWSLAMALGSWAVAFDDSLDYEDPNGPPRWNEDEMAAHREEGRDLARRLASELAETGRGQVRVLYHPVGGAIEAVAGVQGR